MAELDKVIKGLESCVKADWEVCMNKVCPYAPKESLNFVCCKYKMMADALELLKEQEEMKKPTLVWPVPPERFRNKTTDT